MNQEESLDVSFTLKQLIRLQELEAELGGLVKKREKAPAELQLLDDQLASAQSIVTTAESQITDSGKERRKLESEVEGLREKLSRLKQQLMEVKTNVAYTAMLEEIGFAENKIKEKEDQILEQMVRTEELKDARADTLAAFEAEQAQIEAQKREIQTFVSESEVQIACLKAEKEEISRLVPGPYMERFNRIAAARSGVALTAVADQSCGACHVRLRPQLLAEVKASRNIILCENCSRILYFTTSH